LLVPHYYYYYYYYYSCFSLRLRRTCQPLPSVHITLSVHNLRIVAIFVTVHSLSLAIRTSVCRKFGSSGSIVIDVKSKDQKTWHDRHIVIFVLQKCNFNECHAPSGASVAYQVCHVLVVTGCTVVPVNAMKAQWQ